MLHLLNRRQRVPVCEFTPENVNCSQLLADGHLMIWHNRRAVLQARVFADQNPRLSRHIEQIEVALKVTKLLD